MTTIHIDDSGDRAKAFLKFIRGLDFVQIEEEEGDSKKTILKNLKKGLEEVKLAKQGKLETTSAKDFLNEL